MPTRLTSCVRILYKRTFDATNQLATGIICMHESKARSASPLIACLWLRSNRLLGQLDRSLTLLSLSWWKLVSTLLLTLTEPDAYIYMKHMQLMDKYFARVRSALIVCVSLMASHLICSTGSSY